MSHKLRDFVQLISLDHSARSELEIGNYVSWLRRRVGLLKNAETRTVTDIIRTCDYTHAARNDLVFRQGKPKVGSSKSQFYIILRGSVSVYVNPFIARGVLRRGSTNSLERALLGATSPFISSTIPKSASSKKTVYSQYATLTEHPESDISDVESEESLETDKIEDNPNVQSNQSATMTPVSEINHIAPPPSPKSKSSRRSTRDLLRTKFGKFVVKYEKGKSFDENSIMDVNGMYSGTVIADDDTDIMLLTEEMFDKYIKEHHEQETMTMANFVDIHPFFCHLPAHAQCVLQISLKSQQFEAGSYIVRQGDPVTRLMFIVSGSAELIIEPDKHKNQYPEFWPFETSTDVYFNECEWLRESRRRIYQKKYEYAGEVTRRSHHKEMQRTRKSEVTVCAVQSREVIGIAEIVLDLPTHMNSLRCIHDCEIYTLGLKPFRRLIKKKHPEVMKMVCAYVQTKLNFRLENNIGNQVPLFRCLYNKIEVEISGKSKKGTNSRTYDQRHQKDAEMEKVLKWFKLNKAPLLRNLDPRVVDLKEKMKEKAKIRKSVRERTMVIGGAKKEYQRRGCLATVKNQREPRSLFKLRDPMNELIIRLKMEGTMVTEDELEDLLRRYSVTPVVDDFRVSARRVIDEDYKLLRYRRYGNRLVRNFTKMIDRRDPKYLIGDKEKTILPTVLFDDRYWEDEDEEEEWSGLWEDGMSQEGMSRDVSRDDIRQYAHRTQVQARPLTYKSLATTDTYKTLQFERRSVTPRTLDMRIKDFHMKFGGSDLQVNSLPSMMNEKNPEMYFDDDVPKPGGKVFVTTMPCVSCMKNVHFKDHAHIRCQMLQSLPMNKVKGYTCRHS